VKLESQIADHDFLNQTSVESKTVSHFFNSSLILSNINIFASIAIHIDKIKPAIEAKVKVIHKTLTIDNIITIYKNNAIDAITHDALYVTIKNKKIIKNHDIHAVINLSKELAHIFESIVFSLVKYIGAGTTHVLMFCDNSFASSIV
jgi:hypothetical protein